MQDNILARCQKSYAMITKAGGAKLFKMPRDEYCECQLGAWMQLQPDATEFDDLEPLNGLEVGSRCAGSGGRS